MKCSDANNDWTNECSPRSLDLINADGHAATIVRRSCITSRVSVCNAVGLFRCYGQHVGADAIRAVFILKSSTGRDVITNYVVNSSQSECSSQTAAAACRHRSDRDQSEFVWQTNNKCHEWRWENVKNGCCKHSKRQCKHKLELWERWSHRR